MHSFLKISKVTIFPSSSEQQILKDYAAKLLYQRLEKRLKIGRKNLHIFYRVLLPNKKLNRFKKNANVGVLL